MIGEGNALHVLRAMNPAVPRTANAREEHVHFCNAHGAAPLVLYRQEASIAFKHTNGMTPHIMKNITQLSLFLMTTKYIQVVP